MGFRFQKRIKILPGVTVNASKSGFSTSVGTRGARVTIGNSKTRTTVGIPGTGISHTTIERNAQRTPGTSSGSRLALWLILLGVFAFAVVVGRMLK